MTYSSSHSGTDQTHPCKFLRFYMDSISTDSAPWKDNPVLLRCVLIPKTDFQPQQVSEKKSKVFFTFTNFLK